MSDLIERISEFLDNIIWQLKRLWRITPPLGRIGLVAYGVAMIMIIAMFTLSRGRKQPEVVVTQSVAPTAAPVVSATPIPEKIVIDSADQAALADSFDDDDNSTIVINKTVSEDQMMRVTNDWLQPQVAQLNRQVKDMQRVIEKDKSFISINEPQLIPARTDVEKIEQDYKRANAAMDLPRMPNSSFNDEVEARWQDLRVRLEKARKRLKLIEEGLETAQRRLEKNEETLPQIEVEAANMRERLEKVIARDPKVLAITYQYASSGLKTLPLLRFLGRGTWDMQLISEIASAFDRRFRRRMPVTALGQSDTHNRLGWDHSHAADVGVNPSSSEGQWLISYLRDRNIPFMAFRTAVRGVSTGPHVHIGLPSHRLKR